MRTLDATFLNEVVNHPDVRPFVGFPDAGPLDLSALVSDVGNYCFTNERGGFIAHAHGNGVYEVHSQFLPNGSGADLAKFQAECQHYMFTRTDCVRLVTKVPLDNAPARGLARMGGFREVFTGVYDVSIERWAYLAKPLAAVGEWFHDELNKARGVEGHDHDGDHDQFVGATIEMIRADNARKAVWFYNCWARMAGYAQILLINDKPCVIDWGNAVVEVTSGKMDVLKCQQQQH